MTTTEENMDNQKLKLENDNPEEKNEENNENNENNEVNNPTTESQSFTSKLLQPKNLNSNNSRCNSNNSCNSSIGSCINKR